MNKQLIGGVFALVLMVMVAGPLSAAAEEATSTATTTTSVATTTTSTSTPATGNARIAELLAQLQKLTALFNDLKAKLTGVTTELKELRGDLKEGMTDADIKAIQEALASDPSIYPSGLKTGYFGPMTKEAIKRFQAKNGLEVTGEINAETKAALDTIMAQRRQEGKFPLGLLLAPGQHRDDFEKRLRHQCGVTNASSTVAAPCERLKDKYHFDREDDDHASGTSTKSWLPWKNGTSTSPWIKKDDKNGKNEKMKGKKDDDEDEMDDDDDSMDEPDDDEDDN